MKVTATMRRENKIVQYGINNVGKDVKRLQSFLETYACISFNEKSLIKIMKRMGY